MTNISPPKGQFTSPKDGHRPFGPDLETMLISQQRNVEAMMQMSRATLDGVQQAWRRQLDFLEQAVEGFTSLVGSFAQPNGLPEQHLARQAEYSRQAFEKNLASARELTDLTAKAANDAMSVIHQRICDSLEEVRQARDKRTDRP